MSFRLPRRPKSTEPFSSASALGAILRVVRQARWLVLVVFILAVALQLQITTRNKALDRFGDQLDTFEKVQTSQSQTIGEAKVAAVEAKKAVEDAIKSAQNGTSNQAAVVEALQSIHRIEIYLCGGPCPDG